MSRQSEDKSMLEPRKEVLSKVGGSRAGEKFFDRKHNQFKSLCGGLKTHIG